MIISATTTAVAAAAPMMTRVRVERPLPALFTFVTSAYATVLEAPVFGSARVKESSLESLTYPFNFVPFRSLTSTRAFLPTPSFATFARASSAGRREFADYALIVCRADKVAGSIPESITARVLDNKSNLLQI